MSKSIKILWGLLFFALIGFAVLIYLENNSLQVSEMYVTHVNVDSFRKATWVYSCESHRVFQGLHYDIKPGLYRFEYYYRIPWSKLITKSRILGETQT